MRLIKCLALYKFSVQILFIGSLITLLAAYAAVSAQLQEVPYAVGSWQEAGHGNHRALVRVNAKSDAVRVRIPWRRQDRHPEQKDIRVLDASTGKQITNVVRNRYQS